ncbi:MAG: type I pantothenate kinase [Bifidobacteriaceae bacterium]|jgi:type I pantothenate kinase|nr:type I pantothenate kinase [Bifidobacteriaceae bacterium]
MSTTSQPVESPYLAFERGDWGELASSTPLPLTAQDIARIKGIGDEISLAEVDAIYRPLSGLLNLHAHASHYLHDVRGMFLRDSTVRTPYVIGIAGSVAVGKSTVARLLVELLARWPNTPRVQLLPTDGFLYPNAELERRGLSGRKGFPESYDRAALLRFLAKVKGGAPEVEAPSYSHLRYDIQPGRTTVVTQPDVLIVEGLNVLQAARTDRRGADEVVVSDFFDFSIYVDAAESHIRRWYLDRFLALRDTAFTNPESYFHRYASMSLTEAVAFAESVWEATNSPNLEQNILPTRSRASLILRKGPDHLVERIFLRKT